MVKKPDLDEPTRRIAERLLNMPPKPHKEMKLGKSKTKAETKEGEPEPAKDDGASAKMSGLFA